MDWTKILEAQQQDFCKRFRLKKFLFCEQDNLYSEINIVSGHQINELQESLQALGKTEDDNLAYQEILKQIFREKLGTDNFKKRYANLIAFSNVDDVELSEGKGIFSLKKNEGFKILVKTISNSNRKYCWSLSAEEINNYQLIVCFLSLQDFDINTHNYPLILAGFIPQVYLKNKLNDSKIYLNKLFYAGGLASYLESMVEQKNNYLQVAQQCSLKGEYGLASINYDRAINTDPHNAYLYLLKGIAQWKKGHFSEAINIFSEAIALKPEYTLAYHWRGFVNTQLGQYDLALQDYNQEIKLHPIGFNGYYKRGFINTKLRQYVEALEDYSTSLTINPNFFLSYYNRGFVYFQLGDKQDAIDDYHKALILSPDLVQACYNIATIQQLMGNHNQALASYSEAIRINPHYEKSYYNLAILQANLGYYHKAIETYERALKINPNFTQAIYNREALIKLQENEGHILEAHQDLTQRQNKAKNNKMPRIY